jgi:glycosyltransferase involved in cell wall biosynthesis
MQWFIVPRLDGAISGGTLYNRLLLAGLKEIGCACDASTIEQAKPALAEGAANDGFWVDSLYLDQLPMLERAAQPGTRLGLIVHYLPSLIARGEGLGPADVTPSEAAALRTATMFLVPSAFMRGIVRRLAGDIRPILQIEPGRPMVRVSSLPDPPLRALMVANLVAGKGVERFLVSLAEQVHAADDLRVSIVGGDAHDPTYAQRCRVLERDPRLRGRARFLGELPHDETLREMAASNLLVSCSHMESYGMALMEARVLGVPILAQHGGHVAAMVGRDSGGELFADTDELVVSLLRICRNPDEHRTRMKLARARAWPARPWTAAAREFIAQAEDLEKSNQMGLRGVG